MKTKQTQLYAANSGSPCDYAAADKKKVYSEKEVGINCNKQYHFKIIA